MEGYYNCPFEIKAEDITDKGIFEGYGSTFGGAEDSYGDIIKRGAFSETLSKGGRNGSGIGMLWQHDSTNPIGVWDELVENQKGLKVRGQLAMEVQQGKEAYILMKMKALNGLSIGWDFIRNQEGDPENDSYEIIETEKKRKRILKRIELWEISPVTFPANTRATITNVKDVERAYKEAKNIREFENALRDVGLSKHAAEYIASLCKEKLEEGWKKDNKMLELLKTVKAIRKEIGG